MSVAVTEPNEVVTLEGPPESLRSTLPLPFSIDARFLRWLALTSPKRLRTLGGPALVCCRGVFLFVSYACYLI